MTRTVTPRQAINAAIFLGDNVVEDIVGHDDLSAMSMAHLVAIVEAAEALGYDVDF